MWRAAVGCSAGLLITSLAACTFGSDAPAAEGESSDGTVEGTTGVSVTTSGPTTQSGTGTADGEDTTPDDGTSTDGDDAGSGTTMGPLDCSAPYHVTAWASQAVVSAPMTRGPGWAGFDGQVAYTAVPGGTLTFVVDLPCAGPHHAWGLVWDLYAGGGLCGQDHADSFNVAVGDNDYSVLYGYGCENCGGNDEQWYWARISDYTDANDCTPTAPFSPDLFAGPNTLSFTGRENGSFVLPTPDVSALAGIVVSNDPAFDTSSVVIP